MSTEVVETAAQRAASPFLYRALVRNFVAHPGWSTAEHRAALHDAGLTADGDLADYADRYVAQWLRELHAIEDRGARA